MLRFRLRTLLIAVTVLAVPMAWVGDRLWWIRERRRLLDNPNIQTWDSFDESVPLAPGYLWLFGETGTAEVLVNGTDDEELKNATRLYPEARIQHGHISVAEMEGPAQAQATRP